MIQIFRNFKLHKDKRVVGESTTVDNKPFRNVKPNIRPQLAKKTKLRSIGSVV